jgi:dTDP-4-dehydrorhamnose 3,5-epimerase
MKFQPTKLDGVYVIEPEIFRDNRGYFLETYREIYLKEIGMNIRFVQDNFSISNKGTVRGLHYQIGEAVQDKLVMVCSGEILDVVVDLRRKSDTFGHHTSIHLSDQDHKMVLIPAGFAHGFSVLSETASVYYKCSSYYNPKLEKGLQWNDPALGIDWKVKEALVSDKDQTQPKLNELTVDELF